MSNSKISALTSATTPLGGTELLPIVQSSTTKKIAVSDITAGRTVSMGSATISLGNLTFNATGQRITGDFSNATLTNQIVFQSNTVNGNTSVQFIPNGTATQSNIVLYNGIDFSNYSRFNLRINSTTCTIINQIAGTGAYLPIAFQTGTAEIIRLFPSSGVSVGDTTDPGAGNLRFGIGNLIQGTASKGLNFTANTPLAGMTSQLLNWYEDGTWTPNQGAGLTVVGAFSSTGKYTRIGREVRISGTVTGATSVAVIAAGVITTNLPFTVITAGHGSATNVAVNASSTIICTSTNVTSAEAITATGTITFSATYFV